MVFGGRFFTPFSVGSISFTQLFSDTMSSLLHSEHSSKYNSYVYSPIDTPRIHSKEHTEELCRKMLGMDSRCMGGLLSKVSRNSSLEFVLGNLFLRI